MSLNGTATQRFGYTAEGQLDSLNPGVSSPVDTRITELSYNQGGQYAEAKSFGRTLASYTYDGFGQRAAKTISSTLYARYVYGLNGMLLEETNAVGAAQADYIYVAGMPVAVIDHSGTVSYLHTDHLGTPQFATGSDQSLIWKAAYQPFGATSTSGTITQNLRLPGQYFDLETGWNHNGFRDYLPELGRYIEPDPLGISGGINLYGYAANSPTNSIDPSGLRWIVISIWNQQGSSVGHAVASETNGTTLLSSFPKNGLPKGQQEQLDWQQTLTQEGRAPDNNYLEWVPDDNAFDAEVARERNMKTWDWDPNNKNQTNCVNAVTRSLNAGGRSVPSFTWPGSFGDWLWNNQGPGTWSLPNVPWQNGSMSINPSTGEIGNTGFTFSHN
jgi:RHS repeat-associated protein